MPSVSLRAAAASVALVALFASLTRTMRHYRLQMLSRHRTGPRSRPGQLAYLGLQHVEAADVVTTDGFGSDAGATARVHLDSDLGGILYLSTVSPVYSNNGDNSCAKVARQMSRGEELLLCEDRDGEMLVVMSTRPGPHHGILGSWERTDGRIAAWVEPSTSDAAAQALVMEILQDERFRFRVEPEVVVEATKLDGYEQLEVTTELTGSTINPG